MVRELPMPFFDASGVRRDREYFKRVACIDGDLWTYDIPFAAQPKGTDGFGFNFVRSCIEKRIDEILRATGCDGFGFYLTGAGNFRDQIATRVRYKGGRSAPKPFHYNNARLYLEGLYEAHVSHGWEADDEIAVVLTNDPNAVCVSRDKDLRTVAGWHYGYRCGLQAEIPLHRVTDPGHIELSPSGNKLRGDGLKFFYAQCLMGDSTDSIPGCPGIGPQRAYNALVGASTEEEMATIVLQMYAEKFENPREALLEQGRLAWMTREFRDGKPVLWEIPV